ncbi:MAG TPA: hypothetical protein VD794_06360 [Flavisolibacter sp.]|nr:hypothetical protein [Flavisolibacter sp.]
MTYIRNMPKGPETIRKEVHLMPEAIKELQDIADTERRSLKNLMEKILLDYLEDRKKKNIKPK